MGEHIKYFVLPFAQIAKETSQYFSQLKIVKKGRLIMSLYITPTALETPTQQL